MSAGSLGRGEREEGSDADGKIVARIPADFSDRYILSRAREPARVGRSRAGSGQDRNRAGWEGLRRSRGQRSGSVRLGVEKAGETLEKEWDF
jgi:hypothetical protein